MSLDGFLSDIFPGAYLIYSPRPKISRTRADGFGILDYIVRVFRDEAQGVGDKDGRDVQADNPRGAKPRM